MTDGFFSQSGFMPHGHCYLWNPALVGVHAISDLLIGIAYFVIALTLYSFLRQVRLKFSFVILCFGIFIGACGLTHFMEIWTLWFPDYWIAGLIKVITALASVFTGVYLYRLRHEILAVAEAAKLLEEKKLEIALKQSEERFRSISNAIPQLAWMTDHTGYISWYNQQWYDYTGTTLEQMRGWGWSHVHDPAHHERVKEKWLRHLTTGEDWEDTFPLRRYDGVYRWFLSRAQPTRDENGNIVHWFGTNTDITEHLETERELRESRARLAASEAKYKILVESLPQLVWTTYPSGECDYLSQQWIEYTGIPLEQQLGFRWQEAIHPDDRAAVGTHWSGAVADKHPYDIEYRLRGHNGAYRWFKARGKPLRNENDEIVFWFGTCTDIEDVKETEVRLELAARKATEANNLKSAFLANMSHEIRTPLGAILGFTDLLRDKKVAPEEEESFHAIIRRNGEQLSRLINDILDLSKVESGQLVTEVRPTCMRQVVEDVCVFMKARAEEKNLTLKCQVHQEVPALVGTDTHRLKQILTNLIGNAIKFTHTGRITTDVRVLENQIVFTVADTGIGISEDQVPELFQPFSQADPSITRKYGGTGLGLILSRRLARLLGGDLILKSSKVNEGTVFELTIANQEITEPMSPRRDRSLESRAQGIHSVSLQGSRILIVDDSPDNRHLISRILKKQGAEVEQAENGKQGLEAAWNSNFDLILMDVQMPIMDGYTATQLLRDSGFLKPIIALTAHAMNEVRIKTLSVGCDDHMTKPLKPAELVQKVSYWLSAVPITEAPRSE